MPLTKLFKDDKETFIVLFWFINSRDNDLRVIIGVFSFSKSMFWKTEKWGFKIEPGSLNRGLLQESSRVLLNSDSKAELIFFEKGIIEFKSLNGPKMRQVFVFD